VVAPLRVAAVVRLGVKLTKVAATLEKPAHRANQHAPRIAQLRTTLGAVGGEILGRLWCWLNISTVFGIGIVTHFLPLSLAEFEVPHAHLSGG
jgi:hypothetical protein